MPGLSWLLLVWQALVQALGVLAVVCACLAGIVLVLHRLALLRTPDEVMFERRMRVRGLLDTRPWAQRLEERASWVRRARAWLPERLLGQTGDPRSTTVWAASWLGLSLAPAAALLLVDVLSWSSASLVVFPPWTVLALPPVLLLYGYVRIRTRALRRRRGVALEIEGCLVPLSVLIQGYAMGSERALELLARCQGGRAFDRLVGEIREDLRRPAGERQTLLGRHVDGLLAAGQPAPVLASASVLYDLIGDLYDVPVLSELATVMRKINALGMSSVEELKILSVNTIHRRALEIRARANRDRTTITFPMALGVLGIIILAIAPILTVFTRGL